MNSSKKILVFGKNGQVGSAILNILGDKAYGLDKITADFTKPDNISHIIENQIPSAVINTAAYTMVDKAESEKDLAFLVNSATPDAIANSCKKLNIPLIHYSTDYVFDGSGSNPRQEDDKTSPLNHYGASKLAGEQQISASGCNYLIFRTSWVYDSKGKNFFNTILRLGNEKEELRIVNDQNGAPTYAEHLAKASITALNYALAQKKFPSGIYNLCNSGATTWYDFACAILKQAKDAGLNFKVKSIIPIPSEQYPTPAQRPKNSKLDCTKAWSILKIKMPTWQEGLNQCMEEYIASRKN